MRLYYKTLNNYETNKLPATKVAILPQKTAKQPQKNKTIFINHWPSPHLWHTTQATGKSIDIPIEVISQALGHTYGMAVTLGYIMPDRRKVDQANRKVLDLVLKT